MPKNSGFLRHVAAIEVARILHRECRTPVKSSPTQRIHRRNTRPWWRQNFW